MNKTVIMKGGLGNQFFQYSFSLYLKKIFENDKIFLNFSFFNNCGNDNNEIFVSRIFDYDISYAEKSSLRDSSLLLFFLAKLLGYRYSLKIVSFFHPKILKQDKINTLSKEKLSKISLYDGYWQNMDYVDEIEDELRKHLIYKRPLSENAMLQKKTIISDKNSVFVGFRLGDYTDKKLKKKYGTLDVNYFKRAINIMKKSIHNPTFYIFSNDIYWVKKNIGFDDLNFVFIDNINNPQEELELMRNCSNAIIMNSTFHWWGAFLITNKSKIIISPKLWFSNGWSDNIIPKSWLRI